jgi:signal transduction histidine kinase
LPWRILRAPPSKSLPRSCWPRKSGCSVWSRTCCCWLAPTSPAAPQRAPVDLDDLVFEEARRLRSTTAVVVDTSAVGAARVDGDSEGLRRAVRNLADNAARHAAGHIDLALSEHGGEARLTIDDDGPGIPEAERERVLKRFVRLDEARSRDDGGSGLGLAIVDEVVRGHGGSVFIGRSPKGGARVEVTLPAGQG